MPLLPIVPFIKNHALVLLFYHPFVERWVQAAGNRPP
jgi:hypothetical protein